MSGVNTKLWYGGGFTSNPDRPYSARRQNQIVNRMFGPNNPKGPIILPDGSPLYVGHRNGSKPKYANGQAPGWSPSTMGIFTPARRSSAAEAIIRVTGQEGSNGDGVIDLDGFLPKAFRMILVLGKKAMKEEVTQSFEGFGRLSEGLREKRDYLANLVMLDTMSDSHIDGAPDGWMEDLSDAISDFLGPDLAGIEEALPGDHSHDLEERPFETFTVQMAGRFAEILK